MPVPPIPIDRELVPAGRAREALDGFVVVDVRLAAGLPQPVALDGDREVVVTAPTGSAVLWRDAAAAAVASRSSDETEPAPDVDDPLVARLPLRLAVRHGGTTIATVALAAGARVVLPPRRAEPGAPPAVRDELVVLEWDLRAGTQRGGGDVGSRLVLAWRRADRGTPTFAPPPVHPRVVPRLPIEPALRVESGQLQPRGEQRTLRLHRRLRKGRVQPWLERPEWREIGP